MVLLSAVMAAAPQTEADSSLTVLTLEDAIKIALSENAAVKVADTVGAGDSFTGSFCAAILAGKSISEAHAIGVDVSAFVCTQHGAMPDIPEELKARLK